MHHRVTDFDPGWKAIGEDAPGFAFEDRQEALCQIGVIRIHVQRTGQLTL